MSIFLEHDDFKKSRRALVVTCFIVIGLHYVKLNSDEMSLLGLGIQVDKENIIFGGKCLIIYLTVIFSAHWFGHHGRNFLTKYKEYKNRLLKSRERASDLMLSKARESNDSEALNERGFEANEEIETIEHMLGMIGGRIKRFEWQIRVTDLLIDFVTPLTLSALALSNGHFDVSEAVRRMLQ